MEAEEDLPKHVVNFVTPPLSKLSNSMSSKNADSLNFEITLEKLDFVSGINL